MNMKRASVLVIDDNPSVGDALELLLRPKVKTLRILAHPKLLHSVLQEHTFDLVLLDMNFAPGAINGNEGLFWLKQIRDWAPESAVIMLTAYGEVDLAVKALKAGATDFVLKPWKNENLLEALKMSLNLSKSRQKNNPTSSQTLNLTPVNVQGQNPLIGESPAFLHAWEMVKKVAATDANVLITGEHGTGKELFAKEIHRLSHRKTKPLITVDMGAVQPQLFESELFGHVKGAFTDAREDRMGKFEAAKGGTLFLDEIGNLPLELQRKLLVVLQRREVVRVGSNTSIPIDIRLVCATNARLSAQVKEGNFREDLLYRINTIQVQVPPLRERGKDVLLLAHHFLNYFKEKYQRPQLSLHASAQHKLMEYNWPGNVRELEHTIEKGVILTQHDEITPDDFGLVTETFLPDSQGTLADMEKHMILQVVRRHSGNLSAAAKQLGITRQTLYNKMKKYGI